MTTKRARYGFSRALWVKTARLSPARRRKALEVCNVASARKSFAREVERLADWYRIEVTADQAHRLSLREVELTLRDLQRDATAVHIGADLAAQVRFWHKLESLAPGVLAFVFDAALAAGLRAVPYSLGDFEALGLLGQLRYIEALGKAADAAARLKSPGAQRGAWLERFAAIKLRAIFESHRLRFYLTRSEAKGARCRAVEALAIVLPSVKRGTLENYVLFASHEARSRPAG